MLQGARIPGAPEPVENFIVSVVLRMYVPLVPLVLEWWWTGEVSAGSLTLVAALYGISIGVASWSRALFAVTFALGITLIAAFGIIVGQESALPPSRRVALLGIVGVMGAHLLERWNRHVQDCEPSFHWLS